MRRGLIRTLTNLSGAGLPLSSAAAVESTSGASSLLLQALASPTPSSFRSFAKAATPDTYHVPEGHHGTQLDSSSCNIGLGRRRDIALRSYIKLHDGTKELTCAELLRGGNVVLVGVPGGNICTKTMIPEYASRFDDLKKRGVKKVVVVTQETPEQVKAWAKEAGVDGTNVVCVSDSKGYFTQMLGVELTNAPVKNHRYSAYVEDGILLKLNVEAAPAEYKVSNVPSMIDFIDTVVHKGHFKG